MSPPLEQVEPVEPQTPKPPKAFVPRSDRRIPPPRHEGPLRPVRTAKAEGRLAAFDRELESNSARSEQAQADEIENRRDWARAVGRSDPQKITRAASRRDEAAVRVSALEHERQALEHARESEAKVVAQLRAEDAEQAEVLEPFSTRTDEAFRALVPKMQALLDAFTEVQAVRSDGYPLVGRRHPMIADFHFLRSMQEAIKKVAEPLLSSPHLKEERWRA